MTLVATDHHDQSITMLTFIKGSDQWKKDA